MCIIISTPAIVFFIIMHSFTLLFRFPLPLRPPPSYASTCEEIVRVCAALHLAASEGGPSSLPSAIIVDHLLGIAGWVLAPAGWVVILPYTCTHTVQYVLLRVGIAGWVQPPGLEGWSTICWASPGGCSER